MQVQEKPYLTGRTFLFSIYKGEDLLQAIQQFSHHHQVRCGLINAIGAASGPLSASMTRRPGNT